MTETPTTARQADHRQVVEALERLFEAPHDATGPPAAAAFDASVWAHVEGCTECQAVYDRLALADRALAGDPPADAPWSGFEAAVGEQAFAAALDDLLAAEAADGDDAGGGDGGDGHAEVVALHGESGWSRLHSVGLAAAVLLAAVGLYVASQSAHQRISPYDDVDRFHARSAAAPQAADEGPRPSFEVFCVEDGQDGPRFTGSRDAPFGILTCPRTAALTLAYQNPSSRYRHVAFFGVGASGTMYWYGPTPAEPAARPAPQTDRPRPFGHTVELAINHRPEPVRVYGLFTAEPLGFDAVRRVVGRAERRDLFKGQAIWWPAVEATWMTRSIEIVEGGPR